MKFISNEFLADEQAIDAWLKVFRNFNQPTAGLPPDEAQITLLYSQSLGYGLQELCKHPTRAL